MERIAPKRFIVFLTVAALFVLVADQITKNVVLQVMQEGQSETFLGPFQWTLFYNDGIAFGVGGSAIAAGASLLGVLAFALLIYAAPSVAVAALGGGFVLGGALGNLIDRINHGAVVDFLFVQGAPIFNMADVAITMGVFILLLTIISPRYNGSHSS